MTARERCQSGLEIGVWKQRRLTAVTGCLKRQGNRGYEEALEYPVQHRTDETVANVDCETVLCTLSGAQTNGGQGRSYEVCPQSVWFRLESTDELLVHDVTSRGLCSSAVVVARESGDSEATRDAEATATGARGEGQNDTMKRETRGFHRKESSSASMDAAKEAVKNGTSVWFRQVLWGESQRLVHS